MSEINWKDIDVKIELIPKPEFCVVDEMEWRNALLGAREMLSNTDVNDFNTESLWSAIYLCAMYFCKGMMWAEQKAGKTPATFWPRY